MVLNRVEYLLLRCCSTPTRQALCPACATEAALHGSALGAQHVDVVQLRELFGRERFGWSKNHVARVMNDNVQTPVPRNDFLNTRATGTCDKHCF
jgi:hypothetical protein